MEEDMRNKMTPALMATAGLLLVAWSCNVQPGGVGKEPEVLPKVAPAPSAELKADRGDRARKSDRASARRRMKPIQPVKLTGPKASKPAPLPKADKTLAIFHSGNVDGEVDPCG
jgi:hypothetical protein